jgi:hypothetical protein
LKASSTPNTSANARFIALTPAPPVRINVPSMSNRTTDGRSGFGADVASARSFGRRFLVERHALPFSQLIEASLDAAPMEEPLLPAIVTNEPEAAIPNEPLDGAVWHYPTP